MRKRRYSVSIFGLLFMGIIPFPLVAGSERSAEARAHRISIEGDTATCRLTNDRWETYTEALSVNPLPSETIIHSTPFSTFQVTYTGFSEPAKIAFQRAVDVLARHVVTTVPVTISASWEDLGNDLTLGSAGPRSVYLRQTSSFADPIWIPVALRNQFANNDAQPNQPDVQARFNSNSTKWYLGLDGNPFPDQFDFVSVVLHELCHGIGIISSFDFDIDQGTAEWGIETSGGQVEQTFPLAFDIFLSDSAGLRLVDQDNYPNQSEKLATVSTSNAVFFLGPNARENNRTNPVPLFAPAEWDEGSSMAHLDEFSYLNPSGESLMTPTFRNGESVHQLGSIVIGLFRDLGWDVMEHTQLAQFAAGGGIDSDIVVTNPSTSETVTGRVDLVEKDGALIDSSDVLVGGNQNTTFAIEPLGSKTFSTRSGGVLVEGSAVVYSDLPVSTVIRFNLGIADTGVAGVGSSAPAREVIMPARRRGKLNTGFAIRNPGLEDILVNLYLQDSDGENLRSNTIAIPAGGRNAQFIDGAFSLPARFTNGTLVIEAITGQVAVIGLELEIGKKFTTLPVKIVR